MLETMKKSAMLGTRAIISLSVWKVQTSCGFGVPMLCSSAMCTEEKKVSSMYAEFVDRNTMENWTRKQVEAGQLLQRQIEWNRRSLDGLPGLQSARKAGGEVIWWNDARAHGKRIGRQREGLVLGMLVGIVIMVLIRLLKPAY
jgi:hypothetical protein